MSIFMHGDLTNRGGPHYPTENNMRATYWRNRLLCELSLHDLIRAIYMDRHAHVVPFFASNHYEATEWCADTIKGVWDHSSMRLPDEALQLELATRVTEFRLEPKITDWQAKWAATGEALKMETLKVKAGSKGKRKLSATWNVQIDQMEAFQGFDVETELANILSEEITKEIDNEILQAFNGRHVRGFMNKPKHYYFFMDPADAVLFKLTWGGE